MQYNNLDFTVELKEGRLKVIATLVKGDQVPSLAQAEITAIVMGLNDHMPIIVGELTTNPVPTPLVVTENLVKLALEELGKELAGGPPAVPENLHTGFKVEEARPEITVEKPESTTLEIQSGKLGHKPKL